MEFVTFSFQGEAKKWLRSFVEYRASLHMHTWPHFSNMFIEIYFPCSYWDKIIIEFLRLGLYVCGGLRDKILPHILLCIIVDYFIRDKDQIFLKYVNNGL